MIDLQPRLTERDGKPTVVDQEGYELVLRRKSGNSGRQYHLPDPDAVRDGDRDTVCEHGSARTGSQASPLIWRRRIQIEATFDACPNCLDPENESFGPDKNTDRSDVGELLAEMTVDEFDAQTGFGGKS